MQKILVIGGAGFIGINTAKKFLSEGYEVTILDNLSRKGTDFNLSWLIHDLNGKKFRMVKADIVKDKDVLEKEVNMHDAVIHLAAQVAVTTSVIDPLMDFETNLLGTFNVLEAIRKSDKKPIMLYSSTNKVYGDLEYLQIEEKTVRYDLKDFQNGLNEKCLLDFHSPYGCSKGGAEQYVRDYSRIYGLKTVVLRQSCIYGTQQFGIEDQGWAAWFIIAVLLSKKITVYGNGKQVRDLLFVDDLVDLYFKIVQNIEIVKGEIFNVGGGLNNSLSILEFFEILQKEHNLNFNYQFSEIRQGDQKIFISDNTKIKNMLGWAPQIAVRDGMSKLIEWVKNNLDTVKYFY